MLISIITAVYNRKAVIGDALASFAAQTHVKREHVLIDGGSTDGTLEVLRAHLGPTMTLVSEPDGGIYDALNKGIALAKGDVIGLLHSDDLFASPLVLAKVAA
ncbi:MAG: glycosyltransferase, partial [Rhodobacterales bacterium]|nr:glycosyltransferase [Rhodobacterales bacterium]